MPPTSARPARSRWWGTLVSVVVVAAVMAPVLGPPRADSFPISSYPMFSGRQSAEVYLPRVVGLTPTGDRVVMGPRMLGTDEIVQAFETVRVAIRGGPVLVAELCETVAGRAGGDVVEIAIVTDTFDAVAYFSGDKAPRATVEHGRCDVPADRGGAAS